VSSGCAAVVVDLDCDGGGAAVCPYARQAANTSAVTIGVVGCYPLSSGWVRYLQDLP